MVLRALDKEPERRYLTGEAFVKALEAALGVTDTGEATRRLTLPESAKVQSWHVAPPPVVTSPAPTPPPASASMPEKMSLPRPISSEKDISTAAKPADEPAPTSKIAKKFDLRLIAVVGLVAVFVIIAGVLLVQSPPSGVTSVALQATGTPTATDEPTITAQPSMTPMRQPTRSNTPLPATAVPVMADAETEPIGQIRLVYDADSLVLLNQSDEPADISGISFVQPVDEGQPLFSVQRWAGGTASLEALPPGDCFQVYTTNVVVGDTPDDCGTRHKWDQASPPRWFWISDDPDAHFEIRRAGTVLSRCQISVGECLVDVGD
jgi:hypothetical protein